jgi:hypothetical protein
MRVTADPVRHGPLPCSREGKTFVSRCRPKLTGPAGLRRQSSHSRRHGCRRWCLAPRFHRGPLPQPRAQETVTARRLPKLPPAQPDPGGDCLKLPPEHCGCSSRANLPRQPAAALQPMNRKAPAPCRRVFQPTHLWLRSPAPHIGPLSSPTPF